MKKILSICLMSVMALADFAQTAEDIVITPASGDITAALNAAIGSDKVAKSITLNLIAGANYTLSNPICPAGNITINGNGAVIDATNCQTAGNIKDEKAGLPGAFISMNTSPKVGITSSYYRIQVAIKDVTVKGLKGCIFVDNKTAYLATDFTLDNVVIQVLTEKKSEAKALIQFKKGGFKNFTIRNSTIYGNNSYCECFVTSTGTLANYGYDEKKDFFNITYANNTFYNLLVVGSEQWATGGYEKLDCVKFDIQNNIWYNCGMNIVLGLASGTYGLQAQKTFSQNTYYAMEDTAMPVTSQAVVESMNDESGNILTTDPTFANPENGDFHPHVGSLQARYGTGDPRWAVTYDKAQALPADIVLNIPYAYELAAAINTAKKRVDKVGNISVALADNVKYAIWESIKVPRSISITCPNAAGSEGAKIYCAKLNAPFFVLEGTDSLANNADGTKNANYKHIEEITLANTTLVDLSQSLVMDNQHTLVDRLTIEDCVIEIIGANDILDFKGYPAELNITNSTIWSELGHTGHLLKTEGRVRDLDRAQNTYAQLIAVENCTFYKLAVGQQMNSLKGAGSKSLSHTLLSSILYDCTKDGEEVAGWLGGMDSENPTVTYEKNTYFNNRQVQAGWTNEALDAADVTGTSLTSDPGFFSVDYGDFTLSNLSQQAMEVGGQTGDPRWKTWFAGFRVTSNAPVNGIVTTDVAYAAEGAIVTVFAAPHVGYEQESITVTSENGGNVDVADDNSFEMPDQSVHVVVTFAEQGTTGIKRVDSGQKTVDSYYNLNGQRVAQPAKGLYIHNGRKVVIK